MVTVLPPCHQAPAIKVRSPPRGQPERVAINKKESLFAAPDPVSKFPAGYHIQGVKFYGIVKFPAV
jgi:hypothetical protein